MKLAYLCRDVDRYGTERWYLRMPGRPKQRIREAYGTPAFERAYWRARKGLLERKRRRLPPPRRLLSEDRKPGDVYFIEAVGANRIKIGFSSDPELRLETLQTASPFELRIRLRIYNVDQALETALHERFADHRVSGEWFLLSRPIERFMIDLPKLRHGAITKHAINWTKAEPVEPVNKSQAVPAPQ